jgi:cell cycle checkpoint protein
MEIDPSSEKLTFVSNPPEESSVGIGRRRPLERPILRIQAEGSFGSTQVMWLKLASILSTQEADGLSKR